MRSIWLVAVGASLAVRVAAQAFPPPPVQRAGPGGTRIGLLGFGVRSGFDFAGRGAPCSRRRQRRRS